MYVRMCRVGVGAGEGDPEGWGTEEDEGPRRMRGVMEKEEGGRCAQLRGWGGLWHPGGVFLLNCLSSTAVIANEKLKSTLTSAPTPAPILTSAFSARCSGRSTRLEDATKTQGRLGLMALCSPRRGRQEGRVRKGGESGPPASPLRLWFPGGPDYCISCFIIPTGLLGLVRPQVQIWRLEIRVPGAAVWRSRLSCPGLSEQLNWREMEKGWVRNTARRLSTSTREEPHISPREAFFSLRRGLCLEASSLLTHGSLRALPAACLLSPPSSCRSQGQTLTYLLSEWNSST